MDFTNFGLHDTLLESISYMGFEQATPIQEQAIPQILHGKDLIACAQTGTGKTAAFLLPILHQLCDTNHHKVKALIVVPTRELVIQIDQQIEAIGYMASVSSIPLYGGGSGEDWAQEKKAIKTGADIVVATPGKMLAHLKMGYVDFSDVEYFILDEADRMLDIGFYDDIMRIKKELPEKRQTLMFSATMPPKVRKLARELLIDPFEISLAVSKPAEGVLQASYLVYDKQKIELIQFLIKDKPDYKSIIIFSSTKKGVSDIVRGLRGHGYPVEAISSDYDQTQREHVMQQFKARNIRVLVGTDVISRGIDIADVNLIINYNVPRDEEDYVHRVGRTARAESTGVAITLVNPAEMYDFKQIEDFIGYEVPHLQPPRPIGKGPEWKPVRQKREFRGRSGGGNKRKGDKRKGRGRSKGHRRN